MATLFPMSELLDSLINQMTAPAVAADARPAPIKPPQKARKCPTCANPITTIDRHGTLEVYHHDHVQKVTLSTILKAVTSERGKATLKRYAGMLVLSVFLLCPAVYGQTQKPDECDHRTNSKERFDNIRITQPAKVTYYDGRTIAFVTSDSKSVYLYTWDVPGKDVNLSADFKRNWKKGEWFIIYCVKENHIYAAGRVDPRQVITTRNQPSTQ